MTPSGVCKVGILLFTTVSVTVALNVPCHTSIAKSTVAVAGTSVTEGLSLAQEPFNVQSFVVPAKVNGSTEEGTPAKLKFVSLVINPLY